MLMLRLAVEGGGCSGFQYQFELVDAAEQGDHRIERDGAIALVDDISVALLKGSEIDFTDALAGAEFKVRNPNAKSSCGVWGQFLDLNGCGQTLRLSSIFGILLTTE